MGAKLLLSALVLAALALRGRCQGECGAVSQFSQGSIVCGFPPDCCTRLLCPIIIAGIDTNILVDLRINPCSTPTTLGIIVMEGNTVLFEQSDISTSQSIPVQYGGGILDSTVDLFFNSSMDSVTIALTAFGQTLLPPTTIPVDSTGCIAGMSQPPACLVTQPPAAATVQPGPTPVSDGTCQALLQFAASGNVGLIPNSCQVNQQCNSVSCTYLGLFPFTLTLLTCNNPPGINFVAYNETDGDVVFNETVTDSRSIPIDPIGSIVININHPCGQDAIIAEVAINNSAGIDTPPVLPATTIPIDRSDCTSVSATITPCMEEAPTLVNDACATLQSNLRDAGNLCVTNSDCLSTNCDLNAFTLPVTYSYTILPCTAVPSVRVVAMSDGMQILDQTLSETQVQTINVGPTNVSVRFTVEQKPPLYETIGVGVNLISTDPPIDVPFFPLTDIPLDRCACDNISCPTNGPQQPSSQRPTTGGPGIGNQDANRNTNPPGDSSSSNNDSRVIAPAVIAAILFVALLAVVVAAIALYFVLRKKHSEDLKSLEHANVSYKNLQTNEYSLQQE